MARNGEKTPGAPPPPAPPGGPAKDREALKQAAAIEKAAAGAAEAKELYLSETGEVEQDVIEIAARDIERSHHHEERLAKEKAVKKETFYSDLIFTLTNLRYDEKEARVLWVNLLTHKMEMSDRLDRNVGIRVAALDYFKNILGALDDVKIIDASSYIETAQLAVTDGLTGVFNHRYFQDRLLRDLNRAKEEGGFVSLLMIDIDYFKQYNDVNGHIAGDVALKEVAAVLRRNLKKDDLVARYGGEEFAVILVGLSRDQARFVAERIRVVIEQIDFPNEKILPTGNLTVSIGLAEFPGDAEERGDLIAAADRALYIAKRSGKNRVHLSPREQRRERRLSKILKVTYRRSEHAEEPAQEALTADISLGGICLMVGGGTAVGQVLSLGLEGIDDGRPLLGRIVWQVSQPNGQSKIGVKFVGLKPGDAEALRSLVGLT
ncbi:MAG: diguanylate cyclase [Planctomycetes bacterium]|nr:diguanylate cyclase [Planctomycetota bacterium]